MSERAIISEAATAAVVVVFALRLPPQTYRLAQELLKIRQIFWVLLKCTHICLSRLCCVLCCGFPVSSTDFYLREQV